MIKWLGLSSLFLLSRLWGRTFISYRVRFWRVVWIAWDIWGRDAMRRRSLWSILRIGGVIMCWWSPRWPTNTRWPTRHLNEWLSICEVETTGLTFFVLQEARTAFNKQISPDVTYFSPQPPDEKGLQSVLTGNKNSSQSVLSRDKRVYSLQVQPTVGSDRFLLLLILAFHLNEAL